MKGSLSYCTISLRGNGAHLVCSADEVQIMSIEELGDYVGSKGEGDSSVIFTPALDVFVGIRPQKVTQETCMSRECKHSHAFCKITCIPTS